MKTSTQLRCETIISHALNLLIENKHIKHSTLKKVFDDIEAGYKEEHNKMNVQHTNNNTKTSYLGINIIK